MRLVDERYTSLAAEAALRDAGMKGARRRTLLDQAAAREILQAGYGLPCWTVNDVRQARKLLAYGVNCIVTDRLDRIHTDFR